jgi:hypothetical protein
VSTTVTGWPTRSGPPDCAYSVYNNIVALVISEQPSMYSLGQIKRGMALAKQNPKYLLRELNRIYHSVPTDSRFDARGIDIFSKDWDTLIILDGCRYDAFESNHALPGELTSVRSRGAHTSEFLRGNFDDRTLYDTVYTTASPQLERRRDNIDVELHAVENVWNTDQWDDGEGTVRPAAMTETAVEAHETYPNKRHVVHYMQPHYPFIGSEITEQSRQYNEQPDNGLDIWNQKMQGELNASSEEIFDAYLRNLDIVLGQVEGLLSEISGKVVVSADHGNLFGERTSPLPIREWGHPPRLYVPSLVTVPWLSYTTGSRRPIESEPPESSEDRVEEETVEQQLESLGYL